MEYTTNKKYKKPDLIDKVSVQEYNENFDAMDANMAELEEKTNTAVKNASDALKQIEAAGGKVMTSDTLGVGKVDGKTVGVTGDGTLSVIAKAKDIPAEDTSSILGDSSSPTTQALIDAIANKVVNELVTNTALTSTLANYMTKSLMSSQNADNTDMVPTLALTNAMQKSIDTLNSNLSNFQSENAKLVIGKVDNGPYMYLINKITNSLLMLRMNEEDKSIAVNAQTNGAWGSEKLLATKDYLGVIQYNGVDYISLSGKLSNIGEWVKNNGTPGKCTFVRVEPSDSDGYFGTSGFSILWMRTSVNYGWCILISDNPRMVVFGRNSTGWHWYAPSLTEVS